MYGFLLAYQRPSTLAARLCLEESWGGEAALVAAVEEYGKSCSPVNKSLPFMQARPIQLTVLLPSGRLPR